MKVKQLNELKLKTLAELNKKLNDLERERTTNLLEIKMGRSKNIYAATNLKKDIARIKTIINMKILTKKEGE